MVEAGVACVVLACCHVDVSLHFLDCSCEVAFLGRKRRPSILFELLADVQKYRFNAAYASGANQKWIDTGLWRRSRHPNYFGEILLWAGIAVMAIPYLSGTQWVVMLSPLFVYALLTRISGIPTLARRGQQLWGDDPDYQAYLKNTPTLLPRFFGT